MSSVEFLPSSQSILNDLGINLDTLKHSQLSRWQKAQYRAVINWLTKYKPLPNASNLEKVRGCLEAFHHLCELESWEKAIKIFALNLNNNQNVELHLQLGTWGYYQEQIELYKILLGKIEYSVDIVCLVGLGKANTRLGNFRVEQVLRILIKLCHKSQRHLLAMKYRFMLCRLKQLQISKNAT